MIDGWTSNFFFFPVDLILYFFEEGSPESLHRKILAFGQNQVKDRNHDEINQLFITFLTWEF